MTYVTGFMKNYFELYKMLLRTRRCITNSHLKA